MKAIHVNWTKPFFERHRLRGHGFKIQRELQDSYDQPDYQILYTILSTLRWKLHNGPIKLYTDTDGLEFYKEFQIDKIYDGIDVNFLDNLTEVDAAYYWTSGKIQALQNETEPFVFLDQDFIVRGTIPESFYYGDIGIGHWEIPRGNYYFTENQWNADIKHISFPTNYNCNAYSPNTSFVYFGTASAIDEYVKAHKQLIDSGNDEVPEWFWLVTDQGILGHVIREHEYYTNTLTDRIFLADNDYAKAEDRKFGYSEQWYYPMEHDKAKDELEWEHVWLAKVVYGMNPEFMLNETQRFFNEIWHCFPDTRWILEHPRFQKYRLNV